MRADLHLPVLHIYVDDRNILYSSLEREREGEKRIFCIQFICKPVAVIVAAVSILSCQHME